LQEEDKDQEVFGVTAISFAATRAVAKGGAARVITGAALVVEEKTTLMLLLILLFFLHLYYSYNRNTRKEN
jgi:hypothetical protein